MATMPQLITVKLDEAQMKSLIAEIEAAKAGRLQQIKVELTALAKDLNRYILHGHDAFDLFGVYMKLLHLSTD